jgi:NhaA family Na+:H+ antiporter
MLASVIAVAIGICRLPLGLKRRHILGTGFLGGIGFTMSIFITNLAFVGSSEIINASNMAILLASLTAGTIGFLWLNLFVESTESDVDMDTVPFSRVTVESNSLSKAVIHRQVVWYSHPSRGNLRFVQLKLTIPLEMI